MIQQVLLDLLADHAAFPAQGVDVAISVVVVALPHLRTVIALFFAAMTMSDALEDEAREYERLQFEGAAMPFGFCRDG